MTDIKDQIIASTVDLVVDIYGTCYPCIVCWYKKSPLTITLKNKYCIVTSYDDDIKLHIYRIDSGISGISLCGKHYAFIFKANQFSDKKLKRSLCIECFNNLKTVENISWISVILSKVVL